MGLGPGQVKPMISIKE